jgi:DeoR/GlpR family transcriptional regulator of sugar metabolism
MAHIVRHDEILKILSRLRQISVQELTERLGVSEATIRKDLNILEEMGFLVRTHGGALLAEDRKLEIPLSIRKDTHLAEKQAIARKAKEYIREDDTIFLDSGSTNALLAREIKDMNLRVICHSLEVMIELVDAPNISLTSLGGSYRKDAGSFIGPLAVENLRHFQIQTCFIGAAGFSSKGIFSSQNMIEAQLKREVLQVSNRRVILTDHSKYNLPAFAVFANADEIDILITDMHFPDEQILRSLNIEVLKA